MEKENILIFKKLGKKYKICYTALAPSDDIRTFNLLKRIVLNCLIQITSFPLLVLYCTHILSVYSPVSFKRENESSTNSGLCLKLMINDL